LQINIAKNFGGKSLVKRLLQRIGEKNFGDCLLASPIANHRLTVKQS